MLERTKSSARWPCRTRCAQPGELGACMHACMPGPHGGKHAAAWHCMAWSSSCHVPGGCMQAACSLGSCMQLRMQSGRHARTPACTGSPSLRPMRWAVIGGGLMPHACTPVSSPHGGCRPYRKGGWPGPLLAPVVVRVAQLLRHYNAPDAARLHARPRMGAQSKARIPVLSRWVGMLRIAPMAWRGAACPSSGLPALHASLMACSDAPHGYGPGKQSRCSPWGGMV